MMAICLLRVRWPARLFTRFGVDRHTPVAVSRHITPYNFEVSLLQFGGYFADFTIGYLAAVDFRHRRNVGGGAGEEALAAL